MTISEEKCEWRPKDVLVVLQRFWVVYKDVCKRDRRWGTSLQQSEEVTEGPWRHAFREARSREHSNRKRAEPSATSTCGNCIRACRSRIGPVPPQLVLQFNYKLNHGADSIVSQDKPQQPWSHLYFLSTHTACLCTRVCMPRKHEWLVEYSRVYHKRASHNCLITCRRKCSFLHN